MPSTHNSPLSAVAGPVGSALSAVSAGLGRLRPADKPLHPHGVVLDATVHRFGSPQRFNVPWLDEPGTDAALVRFSRGAGLPRLLPDLLGLALRVDPAGHPGDLLFVTTGRGPVSRFITVPRRSDVISFTTYSTLQPYRTESGPVVLSATPIAGERGTDANVGLRLAAARPTGRWHYFASVVVAPSPEAGDDRAVNFDPFRHELTGLTNYALARRLREGAYATARRSRGPRR